MTVRVITGEFAFSPAQTRELRIEEYVERIKDGRFVFELVYRNGKKETWGIPERYRTERVKVNRIVQRIVTDYATFTQRQKQWSFAEEDGKGRR